MINQIYGETTPHKRPNDLTLSSVAKKLYVVKNKKQRMALPVDLLVINFKKAKTKLNYSWLCVNFMISKSVIFY